MTPPTSLAIPRREQLILRGICLDAGPDGHATVNIDYGRWLGQPPTRSDSACLSRALTWLEGRGLVQRIAYVPLPRRAGGLRAAWQQAGPRQRQVRLTEDGRKLAKGVSIQSQQQDEPIELLPVSFDLLGDRGDTRPHPPQTDQTLPENTL